MALSRMSVQYYPSLCRKIDSNRDLRKASRRPCRGCLFNIPRARAGKWTLTNTFEKLQDDLVEGVCSIFPSLCRKMGSNRHLRRGSRRPCRGCLLNIPPSLCRKIDSNRHLRRGSRRPCRGCLFNIPLACAGK